MVLQGTVAAAPIEPEFEVSAAWVRESNIVLEDVDFATNFGDQALNTELSAGVSGDFSSGWSYSGNYSFSNTNYQDTELLDMRTHMLMASGGYDFDLLSVGAEAFIAKASLDGSDYLTISQQAITLSSMVRPNLYLHGNAGILRRDFADLDERSTSGPVLNLRVYYLLDGLDHHLLFYGATRNGKANDEQYNEQVNLLSVKWEKRLRAWGYPLRVTAKTGYETRKYANWLPARDDKLWELESTARAFFGKSYFAEVLLGYLQNTSNQADYDFNQNRFELRLGYSL
ncbi:hypothetical protein P886_2458 [Alteromonadaceae bacterium 2753L.S.0a.02]|nr:hypothetical protein P886_2458 [Alteromonadaceae bacterium 2753L.S.0a.02]